MVIIKNAKIFTSSKLGIIECGDILIKDGVIAEIGSNLSVDGCKVIDAKGLTVIPGIVDAHTHIGGFGVLRDTQDLNEMTNPSTPEVEAIYGIDINSPDFKKVLESGITTSMIPPGSANVICGMATVLKSAGNSIEDMCIKNCAALKVAMGGNPKGVYGRNNKLPMTRMGIAHVFRETLIKGKEYLAKKENPEVDNPPYDIGMENVAKVLKKEIPLKVHCEQFDMMTVIKICEEFDVDFTLEHAWGAGNFIEEIANSSVKGVCFGPIGVHLTPGECGVVDIDSVLKLHKRGVNCCLINDGPIVTPDTIILQAGELTRLGLDIETVIKMITINAAKIIDLDNRIGSIEVGKDADLAIFTGIPAVDTNATVKYTIINGEVVYQR